MQKNDTMVLLDIYSSLVRDIEEILELPHGTFADDLSKVIRSVQSRGGRVLFLDLPSLCSALEKGLESGTLDTEGELFGSSNGLPKIFSRLWSNLFTEDCTVKLDVDPIHVRCLRQVLKVFKRYRIEPPLSATQEKYHEFAEIERECIAPRLSWGESNLTVKSVYPCLIDLATDLYRIEQDSYSPGTAVAIEDKGSELLRDLSFVQLAADRLLKSFQFRDAWFKPRHGPGAVSDKFKSSKFEFPTWPERLENKFPYDVYGLVNHNHWNDPTEFVSDDNECKVISVPKDYRGPRLIASEPISAQFVQQGLLNILRKNVLLSPIRYSVDFRSQEPSRELVLAASVDQRFSTIDLSSASDRLSCAVVECLFRKNYSFLEFLNAARTSTARLPSGERIKLNKFAAQGAAFTFPIQSIVYAVICAGVIYSDSHRARWVDVFKRVRVYGDDMIVPTRYFERICRVLTSIGLRVNQEKSFSNGFFRESCGMDAYKGKDVTSISVLDIFDIRSPGKTVSVVEQSNNLYLGGYINASRSLLETITPGILRDLPSILPGSTAFGFYSSTKKKLRTRWNNTYHRYETKVLAVENKVSKSTPSGPHRLFQWFIEEPSQESVWTPGHPTAVKARYCLRWVPNYSLGYMV